MKIKEIYECKRIEGEEAKLPLPEWHNRVIEKTIEEVDLSDILKMLRQGVFLEIAINKTITLLQANPFIGELYDGELIETLYKQEECIYSKYIEDLKKILRKAIRANKRFDWCIEKERTEFDGALRNFYKKIS
jgi:hypothetical protein